MAKYKVTITRIEYYRTSVVVEAASEDEAVKKTEKSYIEDDRIWDELGKSFDDASTEFNKSGLATEQDINNFINI